MFFCKSGGATLYHLQFNYIDLLMEVQDALAIFQFWMESRFKGIGFDLLKTTVKGSSKKPKHSTCRSRYFVYVLVPLKSTPR